MSLTTRPPGDAARPEPARPAASVSAPATATTPGGPPPSVAPPVAAPPPPRTPMPHGAAALRVFVEEVRAAVQAQLQGATRPEALPPLVDADPGNAVAALLRWLRATNGGAPLPPATLERIVAEAHARATERLQGLASNAARPTEPGASVRGGAASVDAARAGAAAAVRGGSAGVPVAGQETLATARDLVLRALVAPTARGAAGAGAGERALAAVPGVLGTAVAGDAGRPAADGVAGTPTRSPVAAGLETRTGAAAHEMRTGAPAASLDARVPGSSSPSATAVAGALSSRVAPMPSAPGASTGRVPPVDAVASLRAFVDEIRSELGRTVGPARLPSAPLPLVTDAQGAQLGPGLLRWLTGAVAEKGVPLAPLQDVVRAAHVSAAATLPDVAAPGAASSAAVQAREVLLAVRDHVLRGLGVAPERLDGPAAAREAAAPRIEARGEPVPDPRGVPVTAGALVARDDRVEEIGARPRSRADDGDDGSADGGDDDRSTEPRSGPADLQGPMDCIRRYFDAYLAGDSAGYAAQWVYPACVWSDGKWSAYANATACARGNDEYTRATRAAGIVGGRIVMLRVEPTTEDVAVVHAVFTREREDGSVVAETEAAYTTVRTDAGWRVAVCAVKKK